jgi:hypothetical protein
VAHLGGRSAKHYGRPAMFCGLPDLDKFQSGPYASTKCVVTLVTLYWSVSHGNDSKLLKFSIFEVFSYYPCL